MTGLPGKGSRPAGRWSRREVLMCTAAPWLGILGSEGSAADGPGPRADRSRSEAADPDIHGQGEASSPPDLTCSSSDRAVGCDNPATVGRDGATPAYFALHESGELAERARALREIYRNCTLCPRDCRVDRSRGELGKCRASASVRVSSAFPHTGEEPPLVGSRGSGTIFFSHCSLRCLYCQNFDISLNGYGEDIPDRRLAELMLALQERGCHNINLVTPTHYVPNIVSAVAMAAAKGLRLPLVYNTGGYDKAETLRLLDGIVDIYMPDFKYWSPEKAALYSAEAWNYPHYAREAFREMHRQVGVLETGARGIAVRGLIIRHLVLPNRAAGTREVFRFIGEELSKDSYVNVMRQYRPEHEATNHKEIARRITPQEWAEALGWARDAGLRRLAR